MNSRIVAVALVAWAISTSQVLGWGYQGHEVVGSIADQLLNAHAKQQVKSILGFDLRVAAPWPDCVRSVVRHSDGTFEYAPSRPQYRIPCKSYETPSETARMVDYVSRNWGNCSYAKNHGCHESYHFADVAFEHDNYDRAYVGTSDHDVVGAINAAVLVLKDQPAPPPFSIRDKKEALFLLAHFVGDLHQPLHVGAIYLDPQGTPVNPDDSGSIDPATQTAGGNFIVEQTSCKGRNLHREWDAIPKSLGTTANVTMIKAARKTKKKTPGAVDGFAVNWASDTVVASHAAFGGLTSSSACGGHWMVQFNDRKDYLKEENKLKKRQLVKGGARLAELLNKIWP